MQRMSSKVQQIDRAIASDMNELHDLLQRRSGWLQSVQNEQRLEDILRDNYIHIESNRIKIFYRTYPTPLFKTEAQLRRFAYAVARSVWPTHVQAATKLFLNAMDGTQDVIALSANTFAFPKKAATRVASILSACLSETQTRTSYPLTNIVFEEKDVYRDQSAPTYPTETTPVARVIYMQDDKLHAACFRCAGIVFFTLRFKARCSEFQFSWSSQLQCPLEEDHLRLHLSTVCDKNTYAPLRIQLFESFKFNNKEKASSDIIHARSLARAHA